MVGNIYKDTPFHIHTRFYLYNLEDHPVGVDIVTRGTVVGFLSHITVRDHTTVYTINFVHYLLGQGPGFTVVR